MRVASIVQAAGLASLVGHVVAAPAKSPNILFIITDDQDTKLGSLDYMPKLQEHLVSQGTHYKSHYCTISICCPSRVSLWTGKAAHNTNVTDVSLPYGGYPKFVSEGWNEDWFPVWLQDAGYNMYYSGKLFNGHTVQNYNNPYPKGFAGTRFFLDPYTYLYFDPIIQKDQNAPVEHKGEYSNDLITKVTSDLIDEAVAAGKPFFVSAAPIGPHTETIISDEGAIFNPPKPAPRHRGLFSDVNVPRTENYNPDVPSGGSWVHELPKMNKSQEAYFDRFYRKRLQTLQSVDDMIETLIARLDHHGVLDDTFIIYTTDNGFHMGQHRLLAGKTTGYEEDINIPLIIRGPGVPKNHVSDLVTTHTDLVPTFLQMFGLPSDHALDGAPIPYTAAALQTAEGASAGGASAHRQEHVNVEFWGAAIPEGKFGYGNLTGAPNTYKGVRVVSAAYSLYYQLWCDNDHELYDMTTDPGQMRNLIGSAGTLLGRPVAQVTTRLDAALLVLKTCKGAACLDPWAELQPDSDVHTLQAALDPKYDAFYRRQVKVHYNRCELGYLKDAEGPMWKEDGHVYQDPYKGSRLWPMWT